MRHDKEAFATESMKAAVFGKQIEDIIRILYFSAYAHILSNLEKLKKRIDPFIRMFVSYLPITLTYMIFSLKVTEIYKSKNEEASNFVLIGAKRLLHLGKKSKLEQQYKQEQEEWETHYNILNCIDADPRFAALKDLAKDIFDHLKHRNFRWEFFRINMSWFYSRSNCIFHSKENITFIIIMILFKKMWIN